MPPSGLGNSYTQRSICKAYLHINRTL